MSNVEWTMKNRHRIKQQATSLAWQEIDNRHYLLYIVEDWKKIFKIRLIQWVNTY